MQKLISLLYILVYFLNVKNMQTGKTYCFKEYFIYILSQLFSLITYMFFQEFRQISFYAYNMGRRSA